MVNEMIDVNGTSCHILKDISAEVVKFLTTINPFYIVGKNSNTGICYRNNGKNAIYGITHYNPVKDEVAVVNKKDGKSTYKNIKYNEYIKNCMKLYQSMDFVGFLVDDAVYDKYDKVINHIGSFTNVMKNDLKVLTFTQTKNSSLVYYEFVFENYQSATHKLCYFINKTYNMENMVFYIKKGEVDDNGKVVNYYSGMVDQFKNLLGVLRNYE